MFANIALFAVFLAGVSCMTIPYGRPAFFLEDHENLMNDDFEDDYFKQPQESVYPIYRNSRVRRQDQIEMKKNPDGSTNIMAKLPLAGDDKNVLSAIGGLGGLKQGVGFNSATGGLALDNVNGHGLSLTGKHIPSFGNELTAAGKANLFHNDNHDLSANAIATRSFPKDPAIPNSNTYGGGLDYMNKNGHALSLTGKHIPSVGDQLTAAGKANLFHNVNHDLSANAFATRSFPKDPAIPNSNTYGGGLDYMNKNGHALSLTGKHIPSVGDQLTAAGKANLFHNVNHDLSANAFVTRSFPKDPVIPNFNNYGGGLDYMYKDKVGASLGTSYNDLLKRTDYSAMGNLNLHRTPTSSLDLNAGFSRSVSPFMTRQSWAPSFGLIFNKSF